MPATFNSTTVAVSTLTATDNAAVTAYLITESATAPAASATGWSASKPVSFSFAGTGTRTAYAWAKDAAGNVSAAKSATVLIDTTLPTINSVSLSGSSTVTIKAAASDNVAVSKMELMIDNVLVATVNSGSLSYSWKPAYKGTHTITVKAYDAAGNIRTQSLSVVK